MSEQLYRKCDCICADEPGGGCLNGCRRCKSTGYIPVTDSRERELEQLIYDCYDSRRENETFTNFAERRELARQKMAVIASNKPVADAVRRVA